MEKIGARGGHRPQSVGIVAAPSNDSQSKSTGMQGLAASVFCSANLQVGILESSNARLKACATRDLQAGPWTAAKVNEGN
jgi:hypothetical protein